VGLRSKVTQDLARHAGIIPLLAVIANHHALFVSFARQEHRVTGACTLE
jgi:hypothetical protein